MTASLAERWAAAVAGRDRAALAEVVAPDVHYEDPLTEGPLSGPDALADHLARLWAALPDVACEVLEDPMGEGDRLVVALRVTGTHTGETGEVPATGRRVVADAVCWCVVRDGRLWRVRAIVDTYAAAVALGLLPRPGSAGDRALKLLQGFGLRG